MEYQEKYIGAYRLIRLLGRGGFGCVYLAHDERLDMEVAIKLFRVDDGAVAAVPGDETSAEARKESLKARFVSEARSLRQLSREPLIVDMFDFGVDDDGNPYYVMPYLRESLRDRIGQDVTDVRTIADLPPDRRPQALSLHQAMTVALGLARALSVVHAAGLVHRDIKPANILFTDEGHMQLADFGIAKTPETDLSQTGQVLGSREYMSPEQRDSTKHVEACSDVYSFGVLLYRLLTAQMPVGRFALPSRINSLVPAELDELVLECLSVDPMMRPVDGRTLLDRLEEIDLPEEQDSDQTLVMGQEERDPATGPAIGPAQAHFSDRLLDLMIRDPRLEGDAVRTFEAEASVMGFSEAGFARLVSRVRESHRETLDPLEKLLEVMDRLLADQQGRVGRDILEPVQQAGVHTVWSAEQIEQVLRQRAETFRHSHGRQGWGRLPVLAALLVLLILGGAVSGWMWQQQAEENARWQDVTASESRTGFEEFIRQYPDSTRKDEALDWIAQDDLIRTEDRIWQKARDIGTASAYEDYLSAYPEGQHADSARSARDRLLVVEREETAWRQARQSGEAAGLESYLKDYPEGRYRDNAEQRLSDLKTVLTAPAPTTPPTPPRTSSPTQVPVQQAAGSPVVSDVKPVSGTVTADAQPEKTFDLQEVQRHLRYLGVKGLPISGELDWQTEEALVRFLRWVEQDRPADLASLMNADFLTRLKAMKHHSRTQPGADFADCVGCPVMAILPESDDWRTARIDYPVAISKSRITRFQWDACVRDGGCTAPQAGRGGTPGEPVTGVSDEQVGAYLNWLGTKSGHPYRLPMEREWMQAIGLDERFDGMAEGDGTPFGDSRAAENPLSDGFRVATRIF